MIIDIIDDQNSLSFSHVGFNRKYGFRFCNKFSCYRKIKVECAPLPFFTFDLPYFPNFGDMELVR